MENNVKKIIYDVMYEYIKPELDKIDEIGDSWLSCSGAGSFYWILNDSSSDRSRYSGSRLFKDENCWKIFNGYNDDEPYNIIVYFNDSGEITNVEWDEDSEFNAFDKEFMYSIYKDLKKYADKNNNSNTYNKISEYINMKIDKIKDEIKYDLSKVFEKYDCDEIIDKITDDIYSFDKDVKKSGLAVSNIFLLGSLMSLLEIREEFGKDESENV